MEKNTGKIKWGKVSSGIKIWVCGLFLVVYIAMIPEYINGQEDMAEFYVIIFLMIMCGVILANGIKQSILIKNCEKYTSIVNSYQGYERIYINKISEQINTSEDKMIKNIQKMLEKGYVFGISFDINTNEIIFSKKTFENKNYPNIETKKIVCSSCGASNLGDSKYCEYCGVGL